MDQVHNYDFVKGGGLNPKVKFFAGKMHQLGSMQSRLVQLAHIKDVGLGNFCDFSTKIAILSPLGSNFVPFWSHVKKLNYLD